MTAPSQPNSTKMLFLATGLAGSLLVNLSAQFTSVNAADIQGGVFASADEASWISTVYTMAGFVGIATSGVLIRAMGISRYMVASALIFGTTGLACAAAPALGAMIALRAVQGFVAGGFGPAAFAAVFITASGPQLPLALAVLASVLLVPVTFGPIASALVESSFGWQALFIVQAVIGAILALAAYICAPRSKPDWLALKTDWVAILLLSVSLAAAALVVSQGTRRFWFENDMIVWCTVGSVSALIGYMYAARFSRSPIMVHRMLVTRGFGIPVWLNFIFRAGLVVTAYLVPQFLAAIHGYRPSELAEVVLWAAIPQFLALPLAWGLIQLLDARFVVLLGLGLCALSAALVVDGTSLFAGDQFTLTLVFFSVGQVLFLTPILVVGAGTLKPAEAPTASLVFNISTLGGTALGVGLVSNLVTEREKFHSNIITSTISLYDPTFADRVAFLSSLISERLTDEAMLTALTIARVGAAARREALVLAFNDAFLMVSIVFVLSMFGAMAMTPSTPLSIRQRTLAGNSS